MNIVAIIPARGGSKSIPKKNLKNFCGKPLIAWSIECAKKSIGVSRVIVSTDDAEIRAVAMRYGAEAPFLRPAELATDTMAIEPVLKHAHEWLTEHEGYKVDALVLLQSTTPTRQSFHVEEAIQIFKKTGADSVVAVNESPAHHTPFWTFVRQPEGAVTLYGGTPLKKMLPRRQDFPQKCYGRNDLVFVIKPENLYDPEHPNLYGDKVELYIIPDPSRYESDINTADDWASAEHKFQKILSEEK